MTCPSIRTLAEVKQLPLREKLLAAAEGDFEEANGTPMGNAMLIFEAATQIDLFENIAKEAPDDAES